MAPKLIFGAGGIGEGRISHSWTTPETTSSLLHDLKKLGLTELDSAANYPPGAPWVTETLLGESKAAEKSFVISTKVVTSPIAAGEKPSVPSAPSSFGAQSLTEVCFIISKSCLGY